MARQQLYKETLLDHHRHPRNRSEGPIEGASAVERGANPRCGDEVEVGVFLDDGILHNVSFRGRGCSICIASASMMTEAVVGLDVVATQQLCGLVQAWFTDPGEGAEGQLPQGLQALTAVSEYPARRKCVLLSWEALADALDKGTMQADA